MKEAIASGIVELAARLLPAKRVDWAAAMRAEHLEALDDGKPMRFALGCLLASSKALFDAPAERFAIVRGLAALATLAPLATYHLGCAYGGLRFALAGTDHFHAALLAGTAAQRQVAASYAQAAPLITVLLFGLAGSHLIVAWCLMEGRLRPALAASGTALLAAVGLAFTIVWTMADWRGVALQFAGTGLEAALLSSFALWAKRLRTMDPNARSKEVST